MLRKPQVPRDGTRIRPAAGAHDRGKVVALNEQVLGGAYAQRVPRYLQIARPLALLHLNHAALNDVVDVAVADGAA